jgi:anaerobic carbon-monoxide dehydrogenase iron sulfur subunit
LDEKGVARKCNLCIDRETPVCVLTCPTEALKIDSAELVSEKREKITRDLDKVRNILKY